MHMDCKLSTFTTLYSPLVRIRRLRGPLRRATICSLLMHLVVEPLILMSSSADFTTLWRETFA